MLAFFKSCKFFKFFRQSY